MSKPDPRLPSLTRAPAARPMQHRPPAHRPLGHRTRPHRAGANAGFTLVEALIATALLGFSLIVMFGFHSQAVRSNMHARKMTDCTYLAQTQLERLIALPWTASSTHADLSDISADSTSSADPWVTLEHPSSGLAARTAANETAGTYGEPSYFVTWDIEEMSSTGEWVRLRVRCQYRDEAFNQWHGTTVSSYRFRDH